MKLYRLCLGLLIITIVFSCNENNTDRKQTSSAKDSLPGTLNKVVYDDRRESLQLSTTDTIMKFTSDFFSNAQTKDLFLLKIAPGMVKNSKAELQIVTTEGKVIYSQTFDAFYFIRGIYEPDTIPTTGGQSVYENYMENYWKAITPKQYEEYFKKSVDSFFNNIYPIDSNKRENLNAWNDEDINDKQFWNEILEDRTIKLIDITCFDCSEGGVIIGYSRKQNKVITLIEHD